MAATSAHPLLPPLAEVYQEVPQTTAPPAFSETKLVLEDEKEAVAARVDFVYPYHRWFSDAGWGTLLAFGGVLRRRTDGTAQGEEVESINKKAKTNQDEEEGKEEQDHQMGRPFCAFAFNATADGLSAKLPAASSSTSSSFNCTLKVSNATSFDFDALQEETKTLGQTPYDFRTFIEWCLPAGDVSGKVKIVLVDDADDVQEVKKSEIRTTPGEQAKGQLQEQASQQLVRSLNVSSVGHDEFVRRFIEVQGTGPMEQVVRSLWAQPLYNLWKKLQAMDQTTWVANHNWWRCFRELDMMLLHWNLQVDYTDLSPERYTPVADLAAHSVLFPLYPDKENWFMRKPLADDEKGLLIVGDPTGQRTLGERETYLRAHPHFAWGQGKSASSGGKGFRLVHQSKADGIYHYGGCLVPNSGPPAVEICFSFDTTGSMYPYLKQVRKNLKYLVQSLLLDMPFLRISIIAHGDYCDNRTGSYVLKRIDFSNDADQLCQFVGAVKETGGGDEPECYELVLRDAQSLGWTFANSNADNGEKQAEAEEKAKTAETMKALVIIGDEVPHEEGTEFKWRDELAALKAKGIYVYGVQCANNDHADEFYRTLAEVSGGHHLRLTDIKEMERLIKGLCYRQATDFMAASEESSGVASGVDATTSGQQGEPLSLHPALEAIHNAIHTPDQKSITVDGVEHELSTTENAGCRFVQIDGVTYIEQNKKKDTIYAQMANQGHKVTWLIGRGKGWGLVINNRLVKRPAGGEGKAETPAPAEFPALVAEKEFAKHWNELTQGLLDGLLGPNVCVAGGSVLNCLLNRSLAWETAGTKADIDVFVHGVDKAKATELMKQLLATVTERLKAKGLSYAWKCKSHTVTLVPAAAAADDEGAWSCSKCTFLHTAKRKRCEVCDAPYAPAEDVQGQWVPCPPIQIILYSIGSIEELLSGFDLDCCCVAYDGNKVWCHPRAVNAIQKGYNVVDPIRVAPSYSRRLHKYSGRGFAVAVPGLNRDFVEDSLRFVGSLREHGKKISGTNGLLWLLSRERVNPYLKKQHEDDDDEEVEEDEYKEGDEEESESERSDEEEYSNERDPETGLLMKWSEVRKRDGKAKKTKRRKKKKVVKKESESESEENSDDEEYSEERDPNTGLLMKKSEVRARDGVEKKKKKTKKTKKRAGSSDEEDSSDEENSDDEEYSDERDPKTGLLLKNSEVRRRSRAGAEDEDGDEDDDEDDEPSGGADDMAVEDDEDEEDEGRLGDRDPATGILYTRSELRKMLRERLAGEVDDDQVVKERSGTTPLDAILADVTWHTRRSRFELYARFCRDWYWLASPTSVGPLLQGYNRWLSFGESSTKAQGPWPSSREQVQSFLAFPNTQFSTIEEFERHFDLMADKLLNDAVLLVANRRRPRRIRPGPDASDSAAAAASTTTTSTTATTSAEAMDVEAAKVDTIDDVDSNDDSDEVDSGGEEASTAYRLAEVEFYYWGHGLRDVFTHRDEAQRESGRWYFHRDVSDRTKYRTGNFKGLDITFGNGGRDANVYGGILIRAIERVSDGKLFEGPCVSVNRLLAHAGVKEIKDLVALPSFDFEVGNSGAQVLRRNQLYLHFPAHPLEKREVVKSGRVGLSLRRLKHTSEAEQFFVKPYRYQAAPVSRWTKGTQYLVPSLRAQGHDTDAIVRMTGLDRERVESLLGWCDQGAELSTSAAEKFFGRALADDQATCNFFGFCLLANRSREQLLAWIREQASNGKKDGCSFSEVVEGLTGRFNEAQVKQTVDWLLAEGFLYNTTNDRFLPTE